MLIVVLANDEQKAELLAKRRNEEIRLEFVNTYLQLRGSKDADVFLVLREDLNLQQLRLIIQPLFIHSVILTLDELKMPRNVNRINAWPTFLQRDVWEVATKDEAIVKNIFDQLGWKYILVPDEPGLIAARVISMIINEAYFAFQEKISTKDEIDLAMKWGTNYPFGPFEWTKKIGLSNIYSLLKILHENNEIYKVAVSMKNELDQYLKRKIR